MQVAPKRGRPESGISHAARQLGIEETDAKRAVKVASLTPEAQTKAHEVGLDDNRTALLEAAKKQVDKHNSVIGKINCLHESTGS